MSVVGTMYEETVKLGFGKLLSSQNVNNVASVSFLTQFTDEFHVYHFDLIGWYGASDNAFLVFDISNNGGASWMGVGMLYYGTLWYSTSHGSGVYGTQNSADPGFYQIGGGSAPSPQVCEVIFTRRPGIGTNMQFHASCNNPTYGEHFLGGGGTHDYAMNAVRFRFNTGNILKGTIRMYGLRTGI